MWQISKPMILIMTGKMRTMKTIKVPAMRIFRHSAKNAVRMAQEIKPDVIIMDLMMPLMTLFIAFNFSGMLGVYWIYQSVFSILQSFILSKVMPMPTFTEEDYKAAERELMGKEIKEKPAKREGGPKNPNVRSLHHIDDEAYESPAEREARLAARKRDYVEEDETPKQKTSDNAYSEGVTLKEDDRPARKDKSKKDSED